MTLSVGGDLRGGRIDATPPSHRRHHLSGA
jgi:hypothetical protein